jgi:hypothetical protein
MQNPMTVCKQHPASYRDPAGFIFEQGGKFYRQVNKVYSADYQLLKQSGLYDRLVKEKKLLAHEELDENFIRDGEWYKTLLPEQLPFISYPYEWGFQQWKDAALLTLHILKISMLHGMILKDATPFNIQFVNGAPVWIDSLSFEKYDTTKPWIAYHQFAACFIAPLLLAKYRSPEMLKLFRLYPEGIPLKLLASLLPFKSRLNMNVQLHVFLASHVKANSEKESKSNPPFSSQKLQRIVDNLLYFLQSVKLPAASGNWDNYYEETILSPEYLEEKKRIVEEWTSALPAKTVLDLGTNTGLFAQIFSSQGKSTIAVDSDMECINRLYLACRQKKITHILPLCVDLVNPTPATGWDNEERASFLVRAKADLCIALALIHHLAISKNLGFTQIAATLGKMSPRLIIEFIPKSDPKVKILLQNRADIFESYDELSFTRVFEKVFSIEKKQLIPHSGRILLLMKRKENAEHQ